MVRAAHVVLEEEVDAVHVGEDGGYVGGVGGDRVDGVEAVVCVGLHVGERVLQVAAVVGVEAEGEDGREGVVGGEVVAEEEVAVQVVDLGHAAVGFLGEVVEFRRRGVGLVAVDRGAVEDDRVGFHAGGKLGQVEVEEVAGCVDGDVVLDQEVVVGLEPDAEEEGGEDLGDLRNVIVG